MRKVESVDSIQALLAELTLNQERNACVIEQIHNLVENGIVVAPLEQVCVEDSSPLLSTVPAAAPIPLFVGYNFCIGDHVEILNPTKKLREPNKGVILGKTNGCGFGGFLCIKTGDMTVLHKPWKLKNLSH